MNILKIWVSLFVVTLSLAVGSSELFAGNILTNSGFEIAGPNGVSDSADWQEFADTSRGVASERSLARPFSGIASHRLFTPAGEDRSALLVRTSEALPSLEENTTVAINFDASISVSPTRSLFVVLRVKDDNGLPVNDARLEFIARGTNGIFQHFQSPSIVVPSFGPQSRSYSWDLTFSGLAGSDQPTEVFIDNVVLDATLVPEPSTTMLFLAAIIFGVGTRRQRKFDSKQ